jgi:hypothetical protein
MMLAMMLLALQPATAPPDGRLACAPVENRTRAGPPPPVLHAQRMAATSQARFSLSVHRCPGGGFRVQRSRPLGRPEAGGAMDWVPVAQCAALGTWIEAAARLALPAPMLTAHRDPAGPYLGTWYTLHGLQIAGPGRTGNLELEILDPPGAPPGALAGWFDEGERTFQACRDRGHGGEGLLPLHPGRPQR